MPIEIHTELPGPKSRALMEERKKHVARGPFHATPIFLQRAHGAILEDVDGNKLIDFAAGLGVLNVGSTAAPVTLAVNEQAWRFLHAGFNVTPYESYVRLCELLNQKTPGNFAKKSFLANSGAEAVENAVKIARVFTGKPGVLCFEHAFHGRTFMAMGLTAKEKPYKAGFAPFPEPIHRAPFPYCYRWPSGSDPAHVSAECFDAFERLARERLSELGAVLIEPVLGEGGFVPAPAEFLRRVQEWCTANRVVLIADEIQTGFGRTGTLFASEQLGLVPDLIVTAKGLGAGLPIAAVTGRAEIMDAPGEGGIGGTFGGNPLACAAAIAVFGMFEDGKLLRHAQGLGELIEMRLGEWAEKYALVGEARGLGPMQAIECVKDKGSRDANPEAAKALQRYAYEHGVVVMTAGSYGNVLRLLVPLLIEGSDLEAGLDVLEAGLKALS